MFTNLFLFAVYVLFSRGFLYRSLIEQLKKLQAIVKISTMKTTTTSTCIMVSSAGRNLTFVSVIYMYSLQV